MLAVHNPIAPSGPWSLGVLISVPVTIMAILICIALGVLLLWAGRPRHEEGPRDLYLTGWGVGLFVLVPVIALGFIFSMWPFNSEFHQWREVHGTVQQISSRMIAQDKSMSQRYVVVIDGQAFGIDDTRASLLHTGDQVSLHCKREFQFQADSGWGCRWN